MLDTKLYTLLKVAEYRNYTQAAKALNLTQPAVSQHIHALENDLGVKLFERVGNRLVLTKAGERSVSAAKAISSLFNSLKYDLSEGNRGIRELNIGITHTAESNAISEALAKYVSENPKFKIKMITDTQQNLRKKLKSYELDMAIADGSVADPELESQLLDTDRLVLVVDPDHRLAKKSSVSLEDIRHEKLILRLPNSATRNMFISAIQSLDINVEAFNIILEVENVATIKDLIMQRYGVSVLAESACMEKKKKKKLVSLPIDKLDMKREVNIIYTQGFQYPQFREEIIRIYRTLK